MAQFQKIKSKKFEFQKDALAYARKEKGKLKGTQVRIETNFITGAPKSQQWEGVVLKRTGN